MAAFIRKRTPLELTFKPCVKTRKYSSDFCSAATAAAAALSLNRDSLKEARSKKIGFSEVHMLKTRLERLLKFVYRSSDFSHNNAQLSLPFRPLTTAA